MKIKFLKLKREKTFQKGGSNVNPDLFWLLLLFMGFLIVLASFVFGFFLFLAVNKEPVLPEDTSVKSQAVDKERIYKVLGYFSDREQKSIEILSSPAPAIDPSR